MTEKTQDVVNDNTQATSNAEPEKSSGATGDTVDFKTYSKVLGKLKDTEAKFNELSSQIETFKQAESERENKKKLEEGKHLELIDVLTKERDESLNLVKEVALDSQIKNAAVEAGCSDLDAFMKLSSDYGSKVVFGGKEAKFKANEDSLKSYVSAQKERYSYLFKSDAPPPKDAGHGGSQPVDVSKMSPSELSNLAIKLAKDAGKL